MLFERAWDDQGIQFVLSNMSSGLQARQILSCVRQRLRAFNMMGRAVRETRENEVKGKQGKSNKSRQEIRKVRVLL